ncbi:hypothetical protein FA95DRAFT_1607138 [Auriscalpium vulgare]|uniref:Uncharacterized protein n=1 Tax=Auriscalpium vulgare TaxID=40419 RepID=A0ACB8RPW3_9AGAM|nr:hypothetical protein FA95DRAFT_1607138 [Auriscalpium vulgare]
MFHDGYSVFLPSEQAPPNSLFLPTEQAPPSYYDPSNPSESTYPLSSTSPTTPTMSTIQTTNTGAVSQSSNTKLRPKQRAHSGLPEV